MGARRKKTRKKAMKIILTGKRPMTVEQKALAKKAREEQQARQLAYNESQK